MGCSLRRHFGRLDSGGRGASHGEMGRISGSLSLTPVLFALMGASRDVLDGSQSAGGGRLQEARALGPGLWGRLHFGSGRSISPLWRGLVHSNRVVRLGVDGNSPHPVEAILRLEITPEVESQLANHARGCAPEECGGMLLGRGPRAGRVTALANRSLRPRTTFEAEPRQVARAFQEAHGHGLEVVAVYHSHPRGNAAPSPTDQNRCLPHCISVIVAVDGLGATNLRAYYRSTVSAPLKEIDLVIGEEARR